MAAARDIEPVKPISKPGSQLCGPSAVFLPTTSNCGRSLRVN